MIFFNIGWMKHYKGPATDDPTVGNHGHLQDHDHGHEVFNFASKSGRCFGYAPVSGLQLRKHFETPTSPDYIDDVDVVWVARLLGNRSEQRVGKNLIVGAYRHARLFSKPQFGMPHMPHVGYSLGNDRIGYIAEAASKDCIFLPPGARNFQIPTSKVLAGGLGQSTVWYGANTKFRSLARAYLDELTKSGATLAKPPKAVKKPPHNQDSETRRQIEKAAVDHAIEFYSSPAGGSFGLVSVETKARGWDLEATKGVNKLLIEVKGLGGHEVMAELTPNEFAKMRHPDHRKQYVVYVVTGALDETPVAHVFRFKKGSWLSADGRELTVVPKEAAIILVK
jgi:hypothetical protein